MIAKALGPLVIMLILLTHAGYIDNGFVWLDHNDIEDGHAILPLSHLSKAFTAPFSKTGFYRPLITIAHSVDYALYGGRPFGFHLSNILFHLMAAIAAGFFVASFVPLLSWQRCHARAI